MVRKSLLAASLALLVIGVGRPAKADPKFLEAYPDIFGARTLLGSPSDSRPKDAIQNQESGEGNARTHAFTVGAFGRFTGSAFPPYTAVGGGFAYTDVSGSHPWEVKVAGFDFNPHSLAGFDPPGRLGIDGTAKIVAWQSSHSYLPVVSLYGRYRNINHIFHRWDGGIALDQKVFDHLYVTGNAGYGSTDIVQTGILGGGISGDHTAFTSGAGLTWEISRKLSLAGNYVPDNAVENEDFWAAQLTYAVNHDLAISGGGGKHKTFFGQVTYKFGKRGGSSAAAQQK